MINYALNQSNVHLLGFAACLSKNFTSEASYLLITSYNYFRLRNLS